MGPLRRYYMEAGDAYTGINSLLFVVLTRLLSKTLPDVALLSSTHVYIDRTAFLYLIGNR